MTEQETIFVLSDGCRLVGRRWEVNTPARARVFGLHGVLEHSGRYTAFAERLTHAGFALEMIDLRGHGRSDGPRAWIGDWDAYLRDLDEVYQKLCEQGRRPDCLFGHSMGAGLVILWCVSRRPTIRGAILSAPPVMIPVRIPKVALAFSRFLVRLWPHLRVPRLKIVDRQGRFDVSRDPVVLENLKKDPLLCRGPLPVKTGILLLELSQRLQVAASQADFPFLLLQGTGDKLASFHGAEFFYRAAPSQDKTLRLYDGLYHEVLSEPEKKIVYADVLRWLEEHSAADSLQP